MIGPPLTTLFPIDVGQRILLADSGDIYRSR